ncbi:hypothetical protein M0R45_006007 [Rubus argutus]|uniref:Uncharacterized protein n=1 Tax=Rubus argutus TaxID=59490 RepID=A0AAW1YPC3_RUBAR
METFPSVQIFLIRPLAVDVRLRLHSSNNLITNALCLSQISNPSPPVKLFKTPKISFSGESDSKSECEESLGFHLPKKSLGQRTMALPYSIVRFHHKPV